MGRVMPSKKFDGKWYKYWRSEANQKTAERKAEKKRKDGFLVRIVKIHYLQFDLYIRRA